MKITSEHKKELLGLLLWGVIGLIIMFIAMSFSSCGSHKLTMHKEVSIEESAIHERKDSSSVSRQLTKTESEETMEEMEEVTTVYDTNKPINLITGKPPVLSETKKNIRKDGGKKKQENTDTQLDKTKKVLTSRDSKSNGSKEERRQSAETTVPKQIGGVMWSLVALGGVIIVGWIIYKFSKKKTLF